MADSKPISGKTETTAATGQQRVDPMQETIDQLSLEIQASIRTAESHLSLGSASAAEPVLSSLASQVTTLKAYESSLNQDYGSQTIAKKVERLEEAWLEASEAEAQAHKAQQTANRQKQLALAAQEQRDAQEKQELAQSFQQIAHNFDKEVANKDLETLSELVSNLDTQLKAMKQSKLFTDDELAQASMLLKAKSTALQKLRPRTSVQTSTRKKKNTKLSKAEQDKQRKTLKRLMDRRNAALREFRDRVDPNSTTRKKFTESFTQPTDKYMSVLRSVLKSLQPNEKDTWTQTARIEKLREFLEAEIKERETDKAYNTAIAEVSLATTYTDLQEALRAVPNFIEPFEEASTRYNRLRREFENPGQFKGWETIPTNYLPLTAQGSLLVARVSELSEDDFLRMLAERQG